MILSSLISSCSSDSLSGEPGMEGEMITLRLSIDAGDAEITRSSGNIDHINRIIGAVYDLNGNLLPELGNNDKGQIVIDVVDFPISLDLKLIKGQQYNIVLWGQNNGSDAFNTSDLKAVTIDYSKIPTIGNDVEAFYKSEMFTAVTNGVRKITLSRVFARLNIMMEQPDFELVEEEIGQVEATRLSASSFYDTFNAINNEVSGEPRNVVFDISPIMENEKELQNGADFKNVKLLVSAFIFAPYNSEKFDNLNLRFFSDGNDNQETLLFEMPLNDIPLQRNWNTNIFLSAETVLQKDLEYKTNINNLTKTYNTL